MNSPDRTPTARQRKADQELLFKGVTCALIGLIVLLAPYFARSGSVREMMHQAAVVGWFALVLGVAFLVQYGLRQRAAQRPAPVPAITATGRCCGCGTARTTTRAHQLLRTRLQRLRLGGVLRGHRILAPGSAATT